MAVSKRLRFEVLRRDGFACRYCGAKAAESELTIDHVQPVALGGEDVAENLVAACPDCNAGKAAIQPDQEMVDGVADDALRWAKAMEEAAAIKAAERKEIDAYARRLKRAWNKWRMDEGHGDPFPLPTAWRESAEQFRNAGLEPKEVERLIEVAMTKAYLSDRWRYFCGCCWRVIRERQEIARGLIEGDEAPTMGEGG